MDLDSTHPERIVVVGGGAGGLELAIRLARATAAPRRARVTLVDRRPTHVWKPRLHEIATGLLVPSEEAAGYAEQAQAHGFDFVLGEVTGIDPARREVAVAAVEPPPNDPIADRRGGAILPQRTLAYDTAVLAVGSTVNDFGTPGVGEHAYTLDDPDGAERLHRALLAQAARVKAGLQDTLKVVIVGAGTTGVELAAELRDAAGRLAQYRSLLHQGQLQVTLVEAAGRPLPQSPESVSDYARSMLGEHGVAMRFGVEASAVEADAVRLADGTRLPADIAVWASGVKAQALAGKVPDARRGKSGRLATDAELRVLDEAGAPIPHLYGIGDCAAPDEHGKPVGATAQAASQEAEHLARSLARQLRGRAALPFRFHYKGTLVSLGEEGAVGDVPTLHGGVLKISGVGARLAYLALYQQHQVELFGWPRALALAAGGALRRSARPQVKLWW
ncbi:MAG: FAD-dependent oxidoreductase [Caulobacteraceae bacterium]|nr:FAD-dependent oxidoreductase [Caulobacter sp.]